MQPILDALETMGVKTESDDGKPPVHIKGKIEGNEISIKGDISSQFYFCINDSWTKITRRINNKC